EQFTDFETEQEGGQKAPNPAGERLHSFNTQVFGGYNFTPNLAIQVIVPILARDYRRLEEQGIVDGNEAGFGDLSVIGSWTAYSGVTETTLTRLTLIGGLKLPSGNSHRLAEELNEGDDAEGGDPAHLGFPALLLRRHSGHAEVQ